MYITTIYLALEKKL